MIVQFLTLLALVSSPRGTEGLDIGKVHIESSSKEGAVLYSIEAKIVSLKDLLEAISQKSGIRFEGLDSGVAQSLVNVSLAERRLDEILGFVLGSVDLRFTWENQTVTLSEMPSAETAEGREWLKDEGVKASFNALQKFPAGADLARVLLIVARVYDHEGQIEKANENYQIIIRRFKDAPELPESMLALGRNFLKMGETEKARDFLWRLANDYPRVPGTAEAWFLLGRCLLQLDQVEMAENYLEAMTENFAESPFASMGRIYLADAKRRIGKSEEAQKMLQAIEASSMKDESLREEFLLVYGKVLFDRGEFKKSAALLCEFAGSHPHRVEANPALLQAAEACYRGKDFLSALLLTKSCEGREGIDSVKWNQLVIEIRTALHLREILSPNDPGAAALSTAQSLRAVHKLDEAIETLERFFDDPDYGARARVASASCRLEKGDTDGCLRVLQASIPAFREETVVNEAFRLLGDAYEKQGQHELAADAYRGILRKNP